MKHKLFIAAISSVTEAVLLAHLSEVKKWAVESIRTRDWNGYTHIVLDADDRYVWGERRQNSEAKSVDLERFIELVKTLPPPTKIELDTDTFATISYDKTQARIYGRTVKHAEAYKWAEHLIARGTDRTKLQSKFVALNLGNENEVRLAASILRGKGFSLNDPGNPRNYSGYTVLLVDLAAKEGWGDTTFNEDYYRTQDLNEFLRSIEKPFEYKVVPTSFGYDAYISPDGGIVHIGCKTIASESLLEVIRNLVPEKVEEVSAAPVSPVAVEAASETPAAPSEVVESPLHNPQGLSEEEYGKAEGYRLLHEDELTTGDKFPRLRELERHEGGTHWDSGNRGNSPGRGYRTKLTRDELAARRRGETIPAAPVPDPAF